MLLYTGCEESNTGYLDTFIFDEETDWLMRDWEGDTYELVNDICCNDTIPKPIIGIDTTILSVIYPPEDLDYYNFTVTGSDAGQLFLETSGSALAMRLFSLDLEEYPVQFVSTFMMYGSEQTLWTAIYGLDTSFTVLVKKGDQFETGEYTLRWEQITSTPAITIRVPQGGDIWNRTILQGIYWTLQGDREVSVALMKGPFMIQLLAENIQYIDFSQWLPTTETETGEDYRIMIYDVDNPEIMDISDAFEIR